MGILRQMCEKLSATCKHQKVEKAWNIQDKLHRSQMSAQCDYNGFSTCVTISLFPQGQTTKVIKLNAPIFFVV